MERVELHCHSNYSRLDGLGAPADIIAFAKDKGMTAVAITDHGEVVAFPELAKKAVYYQYKRDVMKQISEIDVKPIFGIEAYIVDEAFEKSTPYHCTVLLKNVKGKKSLYHMISQAEKNKDAGGRAVFSFRELCNNRKDLLIGSGCNVGLLYKAVISDKSDDEIAEIAKCFDFIEVQPYTNNQFLIQDAAYPHIRTEQDLIDINLKLIVLGEKLGIPVVATGDVHYLEKEDLLSRKVLMDYRGLAEEDDESDDTDLYFRTTKEMLEAFSYLPEEKAEEIVITNTNKIADMCELIVPPGKRYYPRTENDVDELRRLCESRLRQLYKDGVSEEIKGRLDWELEAIGHTHTEFIFLFMYQLIEKLHIRPFDMLTRGSIGNSLVCFLLGISDINPIQYHLSPYFMFGFDGDREVNLELDFSTVVWEKAMESYGSCCASATAFRTSKNHYMPRELCNTAVENYQKDKNIHFSADKAERIARNLQRVYEGKVTDSCMILVPKDLELQDFTPLAVTKEGEETTYFECSDLDRCFYSQFLFHSRSLDMLERLEAATGVIPGELTYREPEIMNLFMDIDGIWGCGDLPDFQSEFDVTLLEILKETKPENFDELVKVFGLFYGANVWEYNTKILLKEGHIGLSEVIACREDVYDFLRGKGIDEETAFFIEERVRKGMWGRGFDKKESEYVEMMLNAGVPVWFLWSCSQISYLPPRAHAISCARLNWRLGWYKVHYLEQFEKVAGEMEVGE